MNYLEGLYMEDNELAGSIPHNLWLTLADNQFTGTIPGDIGNLTSVTVVYLGFNHLTGEIPNEIGNLPNLEQLRLSSNNFIGSVPTAIFNISTMIELSLADNKLSGAIPPIIELTNLERLFLGLNNFSGSNPKFITNVSKLSSLDIGYNSFSGFIPNNLGDLRSLRWLNLASNFFRSSTPDLGFLSSLMNCKNLRTLLVTENPLNGKLPSSIGNLSTSLEMIGLDHCNLSGSIPQEIGLLNNLIILYSEDNELIGSIPVTLGRLQKLQGLYLQNNKLEGSIPQELCHLDNLVELYLENNKLSGSIRACLGDLTTVRKLLLGSNRLTSAIPSSLWKLTDILQFNLSSNFLNGPLSPSIKKLRVAIDIDLSKNEISGEIPSTIGELKDLQNLSLRYNRLQGPILQSFGGMKSLEFLDLSNNDLSGVIPKSLEALGYLRSLNLSFNQLEGEIPTEGSFKNFSADSFLGNLALCGASHMHVPPCKTTTHRKSRKASTLLLIILPISIALTIIVLGLIFVLIRRRKRTTRLPIDVGMSPQGTWRRISQQELERATNGFNESNLIGIGSFGSVYNGRIQDGMEVAIKVFHLQHERAFKSFDDECEVLTSIRHRNLVKVISTCSNENFKALVLEYMPNGNLEKCLCSDNFFLDISQRLNIMIDVASALEYLHFDCSIPVIHCDLKPSNILLDENMVTHLSDFGISKLLSEDESMTQTRTLATIGYMAPEYGRKGLVSGKGDVYSYGIVLMETFTGKKPTDEIFAEERSLKQLVSESLQSSVMEVVDKNLL
ncbi:receptor kinase-like protein Xa21 [Pistacia vera]|uniref:receptor kinase-like protein Xa21 n=1 Tax=Pistacia vera TaxID=55513 RepID=UPI00126396C9|nr:receptor kinase-like protein Xa21 [Pistacia vera]